MEVLPRDLRNADYAVGWVQGEGLSLQLAHGERRTLRGGEEYTIPITIRYAGDEEVAIENKLATPLSEAYFFMDGQVFSLGEIGIGTRNYTLDEEVPSDRARPHDASLSAFYDTIEPLYSVENGVWLIGGRVSDALVVQDEVRLKVRVVSLYVIAGGEDE